MKYNESWILKCYSKLNSSNEITFTAPITEIKVVFINYLLNIFINNSNEFIYLTPKTYILYSNLHLGILSFDPHHGGKWCLSFYDELSMKTFIQTLRNNSINVLDIQKLLIEKKSLEYAIIKTIKNSQFPQFVARIENDMKNKK